MVTVASYKYFYGAGSEPNREIHFYRQDDKTQAIQGKIHAYYNGKWVNVCTVPGHEINVEMLSTSDKARLIAEARQKGTRPCLRQNIKLSDLPQDEQNKILNQLNPKGPWRIEITNDIGSNGLERVVHLNIFNPS